MSVFSIEVIEENLSKMNVPILTLDERYNIVVWHSYTPNEKVNKNWLFFVLFIDNSQVMFYNIIDYYIRRIII